MKESLGKTLDSLHPLVVEANKLVEKETIKILWREGSLFPVGGGSRSLYDRAKRMFRTPRYNPQDGRKW